MPASKAEAKARGEKKYFTGKPCCHGHVAPRWVSTGGCLECLANRSKSDESRAWFRAYWQTEEYKAKQRAYSSSEAGRKKDKARNQSPLRKERQRNGRFLRKYKLTRTNFDAMMESQGNKCQICLVEFCEESHRPSSVHVDHCHSTGEVRGLLCTNCNHGLGKFRDNAEFLARAIDYLRRGT